MMEEDNDATTSRLNHSIVVARTNEGSLLRKIDALELFTVREEMPIGSYAWQEEFPEMIDGFQAQVVKWRHTVDQGHYTFRHHDFAIPVKIDLRGEGFRTGDLGSGEHFPVIGALQDTPWAEYLYVIPREIVGPGMLGAFPESILWFFSPNQTAGDSFKYDTKDSLKTYSEYNPRNPNGARIMGTTYGLASHRSNMLTTYKGALQIEKNKVLLIGKWYKCQYNPKLGGKCTSIAPIETCPVQTWTQTYIKDGEERTLVLCRDFVKIPEFEFSNIKILSFVAYHPLLSKVFFPYSCAFLQNTAVEVCFARQEHDNSYDDNHWCVVAIGSGLTSSMYWLSDLPPQLRGIIRKEEFPFIKSLTGMEAEHYAKMSEIATFDTINASRAIFFKEFHRNQGNEIPVEPLAINETPATNGVNEYQRQNVLELF